MAVITLVVGGLAWSLAVPGGAGLALAASGDALRAAPSSRFQPLEAAAGVPVHVEIDGLRLATSAQRGQDAASLLRSLGIALEPSDRLSVPASAPLVPGMRIVLDRGVPVTLVDGGVLAGGRAPKGTVAELLAARGIALGPNDKLSVAAAAVLQPGAEVRITRTLDREVRERTALPFQVRQVPDADLFFGTFAVDRAGVAGEVDRTWLVRFVDGVEEARTLLTEEVVRPAIAEVRRVGQRAKPIPPAPAEIEKIIREAAERWGADPDQLLRVAYCESRYDPYAFNPSASDSGLFQFIPATWARNSPRAGYAGASPFDAVAAANTAAMLFAEGKASLWTCK